MLFLPFSRTIILISFGRPAPTYWGEKLPFGTVCGEFASPAGGWVHAVAFSPSGDVLAFASKSRIYTKPTLADLV